MKTIEVEVENRKVTVEIHRMPLHKTQAYAVLLVAKIDGETRAATNTFHPDKTRTREDVEAAIKHRAELLAKETIGHAAARTHLNAILED